MSVNRTPTTCVICKCQIPALGGNAWEQGFAHPVCIEAQRRGDTTPQVQQIQTSGGTIIQNRKGRCIDAPCCG